MFTVYAVTVSLQSADCVVITAEWGNLEKILGPMGGVKMASRFGSFLLFWEFVVW